MHFSTREKTTTTLLVKKQQQNNNNRKTTTKHKNKQRNRNILDLILTFLPGQFQNSHSPNKLSDHGIVSRFLKTFIPPIKKPRRKV